MADQSFTTTLLVDQSPSEVYKAITNPRAWWSEEIEGDTSKAGDIFDYHFEDIHRSKMELIESVPDKRVVWLVLENQFKPHLFGEHVVHDGSENAKAEWVDTRVVFDITKENGKTKLHFVHEGLLPDYECYDVCVNGWNHYIRESLYSLITTGKGQPNKTGRAMTTDEKKYNAAAGNA
ncbi:SRPBCC domain-containing protein [Chitinophaga oryzae]|uniref:SRPBCC domain-containing protein n=1 Tax=Chitinophaga oryzae TaxID=2725414 RepID=A0AAE6ZN72_9BACT|nr:SRPBCC domain-containing protein [Chitinophaga oryzae]QJB35053.1 SRPBCC domain-containing protein [Chitinophaga oryzae]QJB41570.1 SRPBCC domain-containing protein [Chitinophaga oryzae]